MKLKRFLLLILVGLLVHGCLFLRDVMVENDTVYSSKRIKVELKYNSAQERTSPFISLNQTIIKEIKNNSNDHYRAYDLIKLNTNSFRLDDKVFIIVDNEPFQVNVEYIDSDIVSKIEEKRKEILTSDSTKVSVVTGYEENRSLVNKITYVIDDIIIEKVRSSQNVRLRYYAGPDMITIKINGSNLTAFKKVINTK
jgi:hypothetical protein